jgi:hypothetical protein
MLPSISISRLRAAIRCSGDSLPIVQNEAGHRGAVFLPDREIVLRELVCEIDPDPAFVCRRRRRNEVDQGGEVKAGSQ